MIKKMNFRSNLFSIRVYLLLSLFFSFYGIYTYGFNIENSLLILLGYFLITGIGISVTFHRILCHNSFKTNSFFVKLGSFLGLLGNTGSSISWTVIHHQHHINSDTEDDPHSPIYQGFKVFLIDYNVSKKHIRKRITKFMKDPYQLFLHNYYSLIIFLTSFLLYLGFGLETFIFLYCIPMVLNFVMSNSVNFMGHLNILGSYKNYNFQFGISCSRNYLQIYQT